MIVIALSLAICIIALVLLFRRKPNMFIFHLIERLFEERTYHGDAGKYTDERGFKRICSINLTFL